MPLLEFAVITVITWVAASVWLKFIYSMTQPDGALDKTFGWQKMMDKLYAKASKGSLFYDWLYNVLGGCPMCMSFWFAPIWFVLYWAFCESVLGWFVYDYAHTVLGKIFSFIFWYFCYWGIGAFVSLLTLTFRKK